MEGLPYEILIGTAFGLLVGVVPALFVGGLTLVAGIVRDVTIPIVVAIAIAFPLAGATAFALGILGSPRLVSHGPRFVVAAIVVCLLVMIATSQGSRIAVELPRDTAVPLVRGGTLSADAIDAVDASGHVAIRPTGPVRELEGYPPLSPELRTGLEDGVWRFPADLQLSELERRLERLLRTEYDLSAVTVSVDGRGRATVVAAPPTKRVATAVPDGMRAVTVAGLLPTGLEPGDAVSVDVDSETVDGTALALEVSESGAETRRADVDSHGGDGRLTVAVPTADVDALLKAEWGRVAVRSRGTNHEYEAVALLEQAGWSVAAVEYDEALAETVDSLEEIELLAFRSGPTDADDRGGGWSVEFAEPARRAPEEGDRSFLVGDRRTLERVVGAESGRAVAVNRR